MRFVVPGKGIRIYEKKSIQGKMKNDRSGGLTAQEGEEESF